VREFVIPLFGIAVASGTAFLIAYWQREQMRQVERSRRDPSVDVRPPPSRIWLLFTTNIDLITGVALPTLLLILEVRSREPLTRWAVFLIASYVGLIFYTLASHFIWKLFLIVALIGDLQSFSQAVLEMMEMRFEVLETDAPEEKARKRGQIAERLRALREEMRMARPTRGSPFWSTPKKRHLPRPE
jgi:hypothetical protein